MRNRLPYVCIFTAFIILFSACSIQKRVYRNGYHIVWGNSKNKNTQEVAQQKPVKAEVLQKEISKLMVSAAENDEVITSPLKKGVLLILNSDTCGDMIFLKNGEKVLTKISEITEREIKYKRCDYLDGPMFIIKKSTVALIQYANGIKETINVQEEVRQQPTYGYVPQAQQLESNSAGITSFVCAMAGMFLIIPFLAAIPFGIASLVQFKKYPNRYRDKWMPVTALGIAAGLFILAGLIIAAFGFMASDPQAMAIGGAVAALGVISLLALLLID